MRENPCRRWVYVVELDPRADPAARGPVVYVGQTGLSPQARFREHKKKSMYGSRHVRRWGRRLLPEFTSGPYPDIPSAEAAERETARRFEADGWRTFGGH